MSSVSIEASGLSKVYTVPRNQAKEGSLSEALAQGVRWLRRRWSVSRESVPRLTSRSPSLWALKDVSFTITRGEIVGIIGRNGSGKSTLLKLLSRVTDPSAGRAVVHGRVGSLLEVGTGFHPELTGRDNIYLSGSILGMSRQELEKKFRHIVEFSGVEAFLDMPVKRYSSGMYVRLAFAVGAFLEPDILLSMKRWP